MVFAPGETPAMPIEPRTLSPEDMQVMAGKGRRQKVDNIAAAQQERQGRESHHDTGKQYRIHDGT